MNALVEISTRLIRAERELQAGNYPAIAPLLMEIQNYGRALSSAEMEITIQKIDKLAKKLKKAVEKCP